MKPEKNNEKEQSASAVDAIVMWVKRLLFCPDYKFNFVDGELISRECKICGKKEYPRYTAEGHIVW